MTRSMAWRSLGLAVGSMAAAGVVLAAGAFDGTYTGPRHQTKDSNSGYCRNVEVAQTKLVVADSMAMYTWGRGPINAPVKADGTFYVQVPGWRGGLPFELKGTITGNNLEADVGNNTCAGHLSLKKS